MRRNIGVFILSIGTLLQFAFVLLLFGSAATGIWWPLTKAILASPISALWAIPLGVLLTGISWWIAGFIYDLIVGMPLALIVGWLLGGNESILGDNPPLESNAPSRGNLEPSLPVRNGICQSCGTGLSEFEQKIGVNRCGGCEARLRHEAGTHPAEAQTRSATMVAHGVQPTQYIVATIDQSFAGFWLRVAAFILDVLISAFLASLAGGAVLLAVVLVQEADTNSSNNTGVVSTLVSVAFFCIIVIYYWFGSAFGGTPGKRILGLNLVHAVDGHDLGLFRGLIRIIAFAIGTGGLCLPHIISVLFFWGDKKQALHDKVVESVVLRRERAPSAVATVETPASVLDIPQSTRMSTPRSYAARPFLAAAAVFIVACVAVAATGGGWAYFGAAPWEREQSAAGDPLQVARSFFFLLEEEEGPASDKAVAFVATDCEERDRDLAAGVWGVVVAVHGANQLLSPGIYAAHEDGTAVVELELNNGDAFPLDMVKQHDKWKVACLPEDSSSASSDIGASPTATRSAPNPLRTPTPNFVTVVPEGLTRELNLIDSLGFYVPDVSTYRSNGTLHALVGLSTGGRAKLAFFFVGGEYLGTDFADASATISFAWQTNDTVALSYALFRPEDPMCCPTGGNALVRFYWDGVRLAPLDWVPPADFSAPLSRR